MVERLAGWDSVVRMFETHRLPLAIVEKRSTKLPIKSLVDLMENAEGIIGDRTLGLRAGRLMSYRGFGKWGRYFGSAETLGEALQRAIDTVGSFQSQARLSVDAEGSHVVFRYHNPLHPQARGRQHSDHLLFPMIQLARAYLGPGWTPDWVEVDYQRDDEANVIEDALGCDVRFGRDCVGIALNPASLGQHRLEPVPPGQLVTLAELIASCRWYGTCDPIMHIEDVIALRLLEGAVDIEGAAQMLNLSPRSLQRILSSEGVSYRALVERARFRRAVALLRETKSSVTDIAHALGYGEAANFTRAFRKLAGKSPTDFRITS